MTDDVLAIGSSGAKICRGHVVQIYTRVDGHFGRSAWETCWPITDRSDAVHAIRLVRDGQTIDRAYRIASADGSIVLD